MSGTLDRGKDTVELTRLQVLLVLPCCGWPIVSSDYMTCGCSSLITRNGRGAKGLDCRLFSTKTVPLHTVQSILIGVGRVNKGPGLATNPIFFVVVYEMDEYN